MAAARNGSGAAGWAPARRTRRGFTTRASCLFAAGVTAVLCGLALGEVNLLRAGVLAAVVPWIAAAAVGRAKVRIGVRRTVEPVRAVAGQSVTATITVSNDSSLPTATLLLEDRLPERLAGNARFVLPSLARHETRTVSYRIPTMERGRYRIGPLQVRLGDPFGLIELTRAFSATNEVVVAPRVEPLGEAVLPRAGDLNGTTAGQGVGSHGADDASTREYRVGDDLRKIHWRSTARTGSLMVRQEEQLWQRRAAVLLDLRAAAHVVGELEPEGDARLASSLEWGVSAAASVGAGALRTGRHFTLASDPSAARAAAFTHEAGLLLALADARAHAHPSPLPLLAQLRADDEADSTVAVLGGLDAGTLAGLVSATPRGRLCAPYAVLLDVGTWRAAPGESVGAVPATVAAGTLHSAGWRVAVARRGDSVAAVWRRLAPRAVGDAR